ncbi:MAG: hypothetical protein Ct9H300mP1_32180 [Planctomycetaceae bacterium]|nr:MAG: hypothetical protein Ct9H300mP1_32180 [Planctomycetaceae bacterium]
MLLKTQHRRCHHRDAPSLARPDRVVALAAGKDIYVEKPMSHVFNEGPAIIAAAKKYRRVVQHGSQMRSSPVTAGAGKLLDEGLLGEVRSPRPGTSSGEGPARSSPSQAPADVDTIAGWGRPRAEASTSTPFTATGGSTGLGNGDIGDDGIQTRHGPLGTRCHTQPIRITAHGSHSVYRGDNRGDREYPDNMMVNYEYEDGRVLIYEDRLFTPYGLHGYDSGNAFYGTNGYMIFSRRGAFSTFLGPKGKPGPTEPKENTDPAGLRAPHGQLPRIGPLTKLQDAGPVPRSDTSRAASSTSAKWPYRSRGRLDFDPKTQAFKDAPEATAMLTKNYRKGYELPQVRPFSGRVRARSRSVLSQPVAKG